MADYALPKGMKRLLKLQDRLIDKPIHMMSHEEIERLSDRSIPNNAVTRALLDKKASNIGMKSLLIEVDETTSIKAYLFAAMERPNRSEAVRFDRPLLVFFHGGGWVLGHTVLNDFFCRHLAAVTDSVVLSVDYRTAPDHKFPLPVDDAQAAIKWAYKHAEAWGCSTEAIFVMGASAGGNLATVAARRLRDSSERLLAGQILIYPVTDARMGSESYQKYADAPGLDTQSMVFFIDSYKRIPQDILDPEFSPLLAEDLSELPPTLIVTAEFDPLHDEGIEYGKRLQESGVEVTFLECQRTIHGFINYPKSFGAAVMEKAVREFIEQKAP